MKTMKILATLTLIASISLAPMSSAFAAPADPAVIPCPGCGRPLGPEVVPAPGPDPALDPLPAPGPGHSGGHHRSYRSHRGYPWGAAMGGAVLGMVMSGMGDQPQQTTQPTVVVVQQPADDTADQNQLALEIERERAKRLALELELERIKAQRK